VLWSVRLGTVGSGQCHRSGSGEPLVLIHGLSGTWRHWQPILDRLEGSYDVLAVTLAGHAGGPEIPQGTAVSVDVLVDIVERDMDEAGFETAHLVGNSLGGWIALELMRRDRARSVVALSPAGGWEPGTSAERHVRRFFTRSHKLSTRLLPHLDRLMARPRLRRVLLAEVMTRGDRLDAALAVQTIRDSVTCPRYFDMLDAVMGDAPPGGLDRVSCPVLLAWGTKDRVIPARRYSQRLRDLVPAAEWVDLPKLGHLPMADNPDLVARTILEFAARAPQLSLSPCIG
jgi:pimeloyl-ACP methyl ester carboxylesterase